MSNATDTKTDFGNLSPVTGDIITSSFNQVSQEAWDTIFGKKPVRPRPKFLQYDTDGNLIEDTDVD